LKNFTREYKGSFIDGSVKLVNALCRK